MSKTVRRLAVGVAVLVLIAYLSFGSVPDARFDVAKLRGLTPDQVAARLGPPDFDPRLPKWGGWTPAGGESLVFTYQDRWRWRGFTYGIMFENDVVSKVNVGEK